MVNCGHGSPSSLYTTTAPAVRHDLQRRLDLKAFRFDKTGEIAPRAVQKYLENKKIVIAIEKGLIILGY